MPRKNKIVTGAKQAAAFARGECDHQWIHKKSKTTKDVWIRHCRKCGVRVTDFGRPTEPK
jgi:hypothetical protein